MYSWDSCGWRVGRTVTWDPEREREVTEGPHPSACADLIQESQEPEGVEMSLNDEPSRSPEATFLVPQMEVIKPACWQSLGGHTLTKARKAHHCRVLGRQLHYSQKAFPYASVRTQFPLPPQGIHLREPICA